MIPTEIEKIQAWAKAAQAHPMIRRLFPPSETPGSGKFFLWSGSYEEFEEGRWTHPGWDSDDEEATIEALGGGGLEQMALMRWSDIGCQACITWEGKPADKVAQWQEQHARILRSQAASYQYYCRYPQTNSVWVSVLDEFADTSGIPTIAEIIAALLENPVSVSFPSVPSLFDEEGN